VKNGSGFDFGDIITVRHLKGWCTICSFKDGRGLNRRTGYEGVSNSGYF